MIKFMRRLKPYLLLSTFASLATIILFIISSYTLQTKTYRPTSETRAGVEEILYYLNKYSREGKKRAAVNNPVKEEEGTCQPQRNIVLLKTHKTGSSTLQNILYRYGDRNNLTFALPSGDNYFGTPYLFKESFVMQFPNITHFNILANHARYNRKAFLDVMPVNSFYITSLRHPTTQYESLYKYYKFPNRFHKAIEEFAENPEKYYLESLHTTGKQRKQAGVNPMLYDLGLQKADLRNWSKIRQKAIEIERNFGHVVISEYFDESLILLKEHLCWNLEDVAYFKLNARADYEVTELSAELQKNLSIWNAGDMFLYRQFNETLWRKIRDYGLVKMKTDVEELHKIIEKLKDKCLDEGSETHLVALRTVVLKHKVKSNLNPEEKYFCTSFTRRPQEYLNVLRKKMRNLAGTKVS
ncbi:galactosylceramide sulfotransferase-like isoform X2 [Apostichopus japonicus]|uniref:galactosylceramide sulfotransferase-like isoform X2 n=1 Tax=Stichopus japonicus TaxID=307972 RepID=UPI003AB915F2